MNAPISYPDATPAAPFAASSRRAGLSARWAGPGLALLACVCTIGFSPSVFALKFRTTHAVSDIAVGDFDGDGFSDVVTCGTANDRGSVDLLLGNGDGTFQKPHAAFVGSGPVAIIVDDFNVDGHLDVATADAGSSTISTLLGNGDGTFQRRQTVRLTGVPNALASADLDGDGIPDLAVRIPTAFVVILGSGAPGSSVATSQPTPGIAIGDYDGDGILDALAGSFLSLGNGNGTFRTSTLTIATQYPYLEDLNGDGRAEVAGKLDFAPTNFSIFLSLGTSFQQIFYVDFRAPIDDFTHGDFNNDGATDFVMTVKDPRGRPDSLHLVLGHGDGTFENGATESASIGAAVAAGDFNGDGNLDLVGSDRISSTIQTAYGLGDGTFGVSP